MIGLSFGANVSLGIQWPLDLLVLHFHVHDFALTVVDILCGFIVIVILRVLTHRRA